MGEEGVSRGEKERRVHVVVSDTTLDSIAYKYVVNL